MATAKTRSQIAIIKFLRMLMTAIGHKESQIEEDNKEIINNSSNQQPQELVGLKA